MRKAYTMIAYVPTEVIVSRNDDDGRSWVHRINSPQNVFWVASGSLYHTPKECIVANKRALEDGLKQMEYEAKQNMKRVEAAKKLLHSVSPEARIEKLEGLLIALHHNLNTIKYSCGEDGCTAGKNLAHECMDWIESHNIPNLDT